jgi:DNA repair exonuclease SbcCD ATPase subunit
MYIKNIYLKKYKYFSFSRIKELSWKNINPISVIVGRNGSGKSSLITTLLPQSLPRSSFLPDGYYECTIEHNKTNYQIISDFTNKDKPHQFIKNKTNLNISGTTKVQQELFETEFDLNSDIYKLLTMEHRITNMKGSYRRQYLSNINPNNIGLALDKYKKVVSKIKDINSVIKMLYIRKEELKEKLLTKSVFKEINHNREQLSKRLEVLTSWHYILNNHIDKLKKNKSEMKELDLSKVKEKINDLRKPILSFTNIDKSNLDKNIIYYESNISKLNESLQNTIERIIEINTELEKYENYKNNNNNLDLKNTLEDKINDLQKHISNYKTFSDDFIPLHMEDIDAAKSNMKHIKSILNELINTDTLIPDKKLNQIKEKINKYKLSIEYINNEIEHLEKTLLELKQTNNPHIPCNVMNDCDLYKNYKNELDNFLKHKNDLIKKLEANKKKTNSYNKAIENLESFYSEHRYYKNKYDELYRICTYTVNGLNRILKEFSISDIVNKGLHVGNLIEKYIIDSELFHNKESDIKKLNSLRDKLFDITNKDIIPIDLLNQFIDENRNKKYKLIEKRDKISTQLKNYKYQLSIYNSYKESTELIKQYKDILDKHIFNKEIYYSTEYYLKIKNIIAELMNNTNMKLVELDSVIKEQEQIQYTLDKEININIETYEKSLKEYKYIESALSPTIGFPYKLTITFLNKIIQNTNVFIDKVFSYPFKLMELDINDKFDYNFKVKVGTTTIKDISYCSKGQRTMIDLAFNLATIIQLGLTNYPIFLDEIDKEFDDFHKQELISLFKYITSYEIINQLFMVSHSQIMSGLEADTLTLGYDNEITSNDNTENINIKKY